MYSTLEANGKEQDFADHFIKPPEKEQFGEQEWHPDLKQLNLADDDCQVGPDIKPKNVNLLIIASSPNSPAQFDLQDFASRRIQRTYIVQGEEFYFEFEDDVIFLTHPSWSLVGMGDTVAQAEQDLRENARIKAEYYLTVSPDKLNDEALAFRHFLREFM